MLFKPFKPPLLRQAADAADIAREPPAKRHKPEKILPEVVIVPRARPETSTPRPPFKPVDNVRHDMQREAIDTESQAYSVLWRKVTNKKHKTWDGDGTLLVSRGYASLRDDRGHGIGRIACQIPLLPGSTLSISGKDVEIDAVLPASTLQASPDKKKTPLLKTAPTAVCKQNVLPHPQLLPRRSLTASGPPTTAAFKQPALSHSNAITNQNPQTPTPRHDPLAKDALVMKRPSQAAPGESIVDVVIDPILSKHLREHQRAGVAFLYECVMALRPFNGEGAILADEMGLGKTLQTITLLWTLLKQNPIYGSSPVVQKAIVVCPKSVQMNWRKEIHKWLGRERIGVLVANDRSRIKSFTKGKSYQIMIIGYEMLQLVQDLLHNASLDLVILDEGHRLKTAKNKTALAIKSLNTERRVVLSGTPIQNDLSELYHIVDLVNPGLLGQYSKFKREREIPILRGSQQEATAEERELGVACRQQLDADTAPFMLRRTADILSQYLPPKTEYVVFCRPTSVQIAVYEALLKPTPGLDSVSSSIFGAALEGGEMTLKLITILKKACNSPSLLTPNPGQAEEDSIERALHDKVSRQSLKSVASSKLSVLDELLHKIHASTDEKVVVVSNYTSTLDKIGMLLTSNNYAFLRLDGSTPPQKRQELVDTFNRSPAKKHFVFLLSTKAGGLGINLIGASRLVLFDLDWNPSPDQQAMARICRDGQKRPCFIYRLITKGAMDEKIFQRQMTKMGLADSVIDGKKSTTSGFSKSELRDLFTLDRRPTCQTHDLLGCDCAQDGSPVGPEADDDAADLDTDEDLPDDILRPPPAWTKASQVDRDQEARNAEHGRREKRSMLALLRYSHIDALVARQAAGDESRRRANDEGDADRKKMGGVNVETELELADYGIGDDILRSLVLDDTSRIDYVFCKASAGKVAGSE